MPKISHIIRSDIDLSNPMPDIYNTIAAVLQAYPGKEKDLLEQLRKSIDDHLRVIDKEAKQDNGKSIRESSRQQQDQR